MGTQRTVTQVITMTMKTTHASLSGICPVRPVALLPLSRVRAAPTAPVGAGRQLLASTLGSGGLKQWQALTAQRKTTPSRARFSCTPSAMMPTTTNNPALRHAQFDQNEMSPGGSGGAMTLEGAVDKTAILMLIASASAAWSWAQIYGGTMAAGAVMGMTKGAGIAGLVLALATCFKPHWSPYTAPLYALAKGLALGGMSAFMEMMYPGLVIQTMCLTFGTMFSLLLAYRSGFMKFNEGFRSQVYTATGGFFIGMMGMYVMRMCGVAVPWMTSGPIGIAIGLFSVGLASSHLLLDFDNIQTASYRQMPKWYEWYSGFSLMVTLVWMYTSIMRVLMMMRGMSSSRN